MNDETRNPTNQPNQRHNSPLSSEQLQELLDLIPAYSIGATDAAETHFVETNLAHYPEAITQLEHYRNMTDALLHSAEPISPPSALGQKILAAVSINESPKTSSDETLVTKVIQFVDVRRWSLTKIVATAAILTLIVSNLYWWNQIQAIRQDKDDVTVQLQEREVFLAALNNTENTRWVELATADTEGAANALAAVIWEPETKQALLYAQGFPPLESDMAYQLWLIRDDERISAGVFQVNITGNGTFVFSTPDILDNFDALGITPEPASGSPQPTGNPVVFGEL